MTPAEFIDDPNWARCVCDMPPPGRTRHLPTHEDCSRIDIEDTARHLRRGGTLGALPGYEERPGQIAMTEAIANAFNRREHLMIEAGTGTGKSLAYLVPSILWAWTNDTPVIVSTATRNLQSQLIESDIPRAVRILGDDASKFKVALLKGRGNYLCLRAVADFFAAGYWTMSAEEQAAMPDFIKYLRQTEDGDLDRYDGLPRALLSCPGEECGGRRCPFYSKCFVYKARRAAAEAHLVIVNHSLALAEASASAGAILPPHGRIILDEAHNLESIATDHFSREFSLPALTLILNRLQRRGRGRQGRAGGVLAAIERQFQKGAFSGSPVGDQVLKLIKNASRITVRIVNAAEDLVAVAERMFSPAKDQTICRYRTVDGGTREYSLHGLFRPYSEDEWQETNLLAAQSSLEAELAAMVNLLHTLGNLLEEAVPEGELNYLADLASQASGIAELLIGFADETNFVLRGEKDTHAYWIERVPALVRSKKHHPRPAYSRLVAAPLTVADELKRSLYDVKDSVILTSATLRSGNDFKYMSRRLGCSERFQQLTANSPFNYLMQSRVLAADCLPDPAANANAYAEALAKLCREIFAATDGRGLVLFTSYEMLRNVAAIAAPLLAEAGIRLLAQGDGMTREAMTRALKQAETNDEPTVLFGAQSFWEGVDVAGTALSCVVIARIPFAQVGDPIVEARSEKIDREGGSSFRDYALPEAVIRFRQGFGRLIRTKSDRGVVVVADPRIVTKGYGAIFRRSIPATVHTVTATNELLEQVREFFAS